jgi:hypothetical protein
MNFRSTLSVALVLSVASSQAAIQLSHNGSVVDIDEFSATVNNWIVGGADHVFQHSYYYRVGDSGSASLVSTLGAPGVTMFGTRGAEVVYQDAFFRVTLTYLLTASANGMTADLAESALVENLGVGASFRLFQYNDYDINGTAGNDVGERLNSSTIRVRDSVVTTVEAVEGGTPIPDFSEMGSIWPDLRDDITGTNGYNLDSPAGSNVGQVLNGDISYAFQWNREMAEGGAFVVSTDKLTAVPEPSSIVALGLGSAALLGRRRLARAKSPRA